MAMLLTRGLTRAVLGVVGIAGLAAGQVVTQEQDTRITGPRGRTIERDIKVERGPGFVDRQVEIKRPGQTIIRDTRIQGMPGGRGLGPMYGGGPRYYGGPRYVENVIVQRPPVFSAFVGVPALSFVFGGSPPPPVVVGGPPAPPQPPPAFDPFADAMGRLKSFHGSSRRDGALTLGRLGDPRAVPALNERLEHDFDKEVRVASAFALGEIADERGVVALEKAALYDHRNEVREAAKVALKKIPKPGEIVDPSVPSVPSTARSRTPPPLPTQPGPIDPGPGRTSRSSVPAEPILEEATPPPPVPAGSKPPVLDRPIDPGPGLT